MSNFLHVIKRNGSKEEVHFDKIHKRLLSLCNQSQKENLDIAKVSKKVIKGLYPGVTTVKLDNLASEVCAALVTNHIEYLNLAGRIVISNMHKQTNSKFSDVMSDLYNNINKNTGTKSTLMCDDFYQVVQENADVLNDAIDYERDYNISYFGFKTLERSYLLKIDDVFAMLRYPFTSQEAKQLNKRIFETMYYGALRMSCDLAREEGTYETYAGSPVSRGILQPDMWNVPCSNYDGLLDWDQLRADIAAHGVRNSLLVAPMPTASTSQILGNNECFEAFTDNIYLRRVTSGEFVVVNRYLIEDLIQPERRHEKRDYDLCSGEEMQPDSQEQPRASSCSGSGR